MLNFQEGRRERKNINQALTSSTLEEWEKERRVTNAHTHTHVLTHTHTGKSQKINRKIKTT